MSEINNDEDENNNRMSFNITPEMRVKMPTYMRHVDRVCFFLALSTWMDGTREIPKLSTKYYGMGIFEKEKVKRDWPVCGR